MITILDLILTETNSLSVGPKICGQKDIQADLFAAAMARGTCHFPKGYFRFFVYFYFVFICNPPNSVNYRQIKLVSNNKIILHFSAFDTVPKNLPVAMTVVNPAENTEVNNLQKKNIINRLLQDDVLFSLEKSN